MAGGATVRCECIKKNNDDVFPLRSEINDRSETRGIIRGFMCKQTETDR